VATNSALRRAGVGIVLVYLALSGVEIIRTGAFGVSPWLRTGFYPSESQPAGRLPRAFAWTAGRHGMLREPVLGQVVRLSLGAPGRLGVIDVKVTLDGREIDVVPIDSGEFRDLQIPIAALRSARAAKARRLGSGSLVRFEDGLPPTAFRRVAVRYWPPSERTRLLSGWGAASRPDVLEIGFETATTFVPQGIADRRELGAAVGELSWLQELPAEGVGFYDWEHQGERVFRWTGRWAAQPLPPAGDVTDRVLVGAIRSHPRTEGADPLAVTFFCGGEQVAELLLEDADWTPLRLDLSEVPGSSLLAVRVSRTWSPARAGVSADQRDLGVALTPLSWQ